MEFYQPAVFTEMRQPLLPLDPWRWPFQLRLKNLLHVYGDKFLNEFLKAHILSSCVLV